jgi:glycosyltransferase involved in cell wall biosynthesis
MEIYGDLMMLNEARMPRVSVLMPTFAHARFIARAIESLLAQSLPQ